DLVAQLVDDARRELRPHPLGLGEGGAVLRQDRRGERLGGEDAEDRKAELGADPLHRRHQLEGVALGLVDEAVEMDVVLADMRLDDQPRRLTHRRQEAHGASRAEDEIADAADIDDDAVGAAPIDDPGELRDHGAASAMAASRIASMTPSRLSITSLFQKRRTRKPACSRMRVRRASASAASACWLPSSSTTRRRSWQMKSTGKPRGGSSRRDFSPPLSAAPRTS